MLPSQGHSLLLNTLKTRRGSHACNPIPQRAEAGGSRFKASLGYIDISKYLHMWASGRTPAPAAGEERKQDSLAAQGAVGRRVGSLALCAPGPFGLSEHLCPPPPKAAVPVEHTDTGIKWCIYLLNVTTRMTKGRAGLWHHTVPSSGAAGLRDSRSSL
jgi:hypothetical protein